MKRTKHYDCTGDKLVPLYIGLDPYPSDNRIFWTLVVAGCVFGIVVGALAWFV